MRVLSNNNNIHMGQINNEIKKIPLLPPSSHTKPSQQQVSDSVLTSAQKTIQSYQTVHHYYGDNEKSSNSQKFLIHQPSPHMAMMPVSPKERQHQQQQLEFTSSTFAATMMTKTQINSTIQSSEQQNQQQLLPQQLNVEDDQQISHELLQLKKKGLYFRFASTKFGSVVIGSLVRTKIILCNATNHEVSERRDFLNLFSLKQFSLISNLGARIFRRPRSSILQPSQRRENET
jgi:hypothetical protein